MKPEFIKDDKQNIVTIKVNDIKVVMDYDDFYRIINNYSLTNITTKFTKEQWVITSDYINKNKVITFTRKDKSFNFKTSQVPTQIFK